MHVSGGRAKARVLGAGEVSREGETVCEEEKAREMVESIWHSMYVEYMGGWCYYGRSMDVTS